MSGSDSHRIPPNRVALSLVLLLIAWLVFSFYPRDKPPPPATPPPVVESKLRAVGLRDNPDWDGLPEFFAIWAEYAEWQEGKTRFAYWHPVMKTYSYYFEAVRVGEIYRFKEIAEPRDSDHYWDENLGEECPIRFFRLFPSFAVRPHSTVISDPAGNDSIKVKVDMAAPRILVPGANGSLQKPAAKP